MQEMQKVKKGDLPEGEIFALHDLQDEGKSSFILTPNAPKEFACFACRIKDQVLVSDWFQEGAPKEQAVKAMRQIIYIKKFGYYKTDEKMLDEELSMFREDKYRCAFCGHECTSPNGPCPCRKTS